MMSDDYCYLNKWYNTYKATNANCTHSTLYTVLLYCTIFSVFAWQGCGWTWSCTLAWCWMKTWKIFVCEAIEIIILRGGPVLPHQNIIWGSKTKHKAGTRITTQKAPIMIYVRFKVTVCVYSAPPALRQVCLQLWLSSSIETLHIMHNCYAGLEMSPSRHWPRIQRSWTKTSINSLESMCNTTNSQMRCCRTKIQEFRLRMEGRFQVK